MIAIEKQLIDYLLGNKWKIKTSFKADKQGSRMRSRKGKQRGGPKMAEEQDGETTFSLTNSSKEHFNAKQTPQNNF